MYKLLAIASLAVLLSACGDKEESTKAANDVKASSEQTTVAKDAPKAPPVIDKAALTEQAKGAVSALAGALKGELEAAMQVGGPIQALDICHTKAPQIAQSISAEKGITITRVSLKNRNPTMGSANDWQTQVLNDFDKRKSGGEDPNNLVYSEVVGSEYRFMKAIPTGNLCLKCHGTEINPEVQAKIQQLYPQDKATGFKEGDIRGAFSVVKNFGQ